LFVPNAIELVLVLLELNEPVLRSNPFKLREPLVNVVISVTPVVNVLPKLQAPPTPSNVINPLIVTPLVVTVLPVLVELNVTVPVALHTVPASNVMAPDTARVGVVPVANVTVPALVVILPHVNAPVLVTVYVAAWSKNTESTGPGGGAPVAPPDENDQLVVDVVFHVPAPPTQ
jgi:hypothetical protein